MGDNFVRAVPWWHTDDRIVPGRDTRRPVSSLERVAHELRLSLSLPVGAVGMTSYGVTWEVSWST